MDRPSGSIQSRGPPASTWLNTTRRACGETPATVCHCPDAHLQSPSGGKRRCRRGAVARRRADEPFFFERVPVQISGGGVWQSGCWRSDKRSHKASEVIRNPDFSEPHAGFLHAVYSKRGQKRWLFSLRIGLLIIGRIFWWKMSQDDDFKCLVLSTTHRYPAYCHGGGKKPENSHNRDANITRLWTFFTQKWLKNWLS